MKKTILPLCVVLALSLPIFVQSLEKSKTEMLETQVLALKQRIAHLESTLRFVKLESGSINGLAGPHLIFEGVNVHVRSGSGSTSDNLYRGEPLRGLGNLVVGYNEMMQAAPLLRTGSHNLIIGPLHSYASFSGFISGSTNAVSAPYASVTGGIHNKAGGMYSSISGGSNNEASSQGSSISGGANNVTQGSYSSISGGSENLAASLNSSVNGGWGNVASGVYSCVSGGSNNTARGDFSACTGGRNKVIIEN